MICDNEINKEQDEQNDTSNDSGFKTVIHDSKVLPMLLKSNIDELKDKSLDEIVACLNIGADGRTVIGKNTEILGPGGKIRVDSLFDVTIPGSDETISVIVNIEGQNNPKPKYPLEKRAEYYMARLVSSQKGTVFKGKDYGKMRKTYSIWYVMNPRADDRNTITRYSMKPENIYGTDRPMKEMDTFNIIFVNLGSYDNSLSDPLAFTTILFKLPVDERDSLMKQKYNIVVDDILRKELDEMVSVWEDTYDYGFDEGYNKCLDDIIVDYSDRVRSKMIETGSSLEEVVSTLSIPDIIRKPLMERMSDM